MTTSPPVPRRRLIADLRRLRQLSGLSVEQVSTRARISATALVEVEDGLIESHLHLLGSLLRVYDLSTAQIDEFEQIARTTTEPGWWQIARGAVLEGTRTLAGIEAESDWEHDFSLIVPGLLQTRAFAAATIAAAWPEAGPDDVQGGVEIRMRRQQRLGEMRFHTVIAEEALLRWVGGAAVMRGQLQALADANERPGVTVQVLSREAGAHPAPCGSVVLVGTDPPNAMTAVYQEGTGWDRCREEPAVVEPYERPMRTLQEMALTPDHSRLRILELADQFDR